jgi:hypothetical protein
VTIPKKPLGRGLSWFSDIELTNEHGESSFLLLDGGGFCEAFYHRGNHLSRGHIERTTFIGNIYMREHSIVFDSCETSAPDPF